MYTAVDFDNKTNIAKVGRVASFLLTGLHRNTNYSIQVTSYGDKRFVESEPVSITVQTDSNGELNKQIFFLPCGNVKIVHVLRQKECLACQTTQQSCHQNSFKTRPTAIILISIFFSSDKSTVKDISLKFLGSSTLELTWEKPRDKYKVFSYRVFINWTNPHGLQNMREVCHGNATFCVYNWDVTHKHSYHVMAYVVHEIPLVRIVGRLVQFFQ